MTARPGAGPPAGSGPPRGPMGGGPMGFGGMGGRPMGAGGKPKDFRGTLKRLLGELRPELSVIVVVLGLSVVSVLFAIVGPKLLGEATNVLFEGVVSAQMPAGLTQAQVEAGLRATGQAQLADMLSGMTVVPGQGVDFAALGQILLTLAILYLMSAVLSWAAAYLMAGVAQRTVYGLRRKVDLKLARLPLRYFDTHPRGDTLSRVTNDVDNIAQTLQQTLTQLITALLTVVGVLIIMYTISPLLATISLLVVPLSLVITVLIARRSQKEFTVQWARTGTLNGQVEEMHTGHGLVKVFGHQDEAIAIFDAENETLYQASFRAQFISGTIQPVMNFIGNLNYVAIAVVGGVQVANGALSLGAVQAFIQYSRQFTMPIAQVASIINVLQSAVASAERVFELLDEPEETPDVAVTQLPERTTGHIRLEGVSFRYDPQTPLIDGFDLDVRPGQMVAIVGPTGAGKTTLVNLLMRFYEIDAGRILIDGVDTRQLRRDDLRRRFGMVLQDTWLFGGTIRENIAYGALGATDEHIVAAAQAAHVDHFVRTLPEGYETVIDDDASNLSAGEKQLLTIARAFLADPQVLILDEATSSVDTRTEVLVQKAMSRLMLGRTSFVIAHRLSTVRGADSILVLDHGRIVEQGRHDELLAAGGFYHDLYNSQFVEALAPTG
jgi:ATP-binding cassette subfamily B multidrug efflux pump